MNISCIEWTGITWNPTTGCTKISSGCKNCYAERWALMQQKRGIQQYSDGFKLSLAPNRLADPFKWKNPQIVFVNSMSDLFHEDVPDRYILEVFKVMNECSRHKFQVLTKRINRVVKMASELTWTHNIWFGVSVENMTTISRIENLKLIPAAIRFVSFEPLLEKIIDIDYNGIDWVIVGGESGSQARIIDNEWVAIIKNSCKINNIPFFFKQWGKRSFNPDYNDPTLDKKHKYHSKGGCMIDSKIYREIPT